MKKVTIIVISYNEKQYLEECLNSCLSQKNIDLIEIIIGDDGSDDGSLEIIRKYAEKYNNIISYFVMDRKESNIIPSIRVSNIIKFALDLSSAEYCICISGDDKFLDNNFISDGYFSLEDDKNCNFSAIVANQFQKFWDDGQSELVKNTILPSGFYWLGDYLHISCMLFRKNVAKEHILNRFCDDTGLQYSLLCGGKWKYIDKITFGYRQRDKSIMHTADVFELNLIELLLLQDCLNHKKGTKRLSFYTKSRFYYPLKYVYKNIDKIDDDKYMKYKVSSSQFNTDILKMCKKNHLKIRFMLMESFISRFFYYVLKHYIYK